MDRSQCAVCRWCADKSVVRNCDLRHERMQCDRLPHRVLKVCEEGCVHVVEFVPLFNGLGIWGETNVQDGDESLPRVSDEEDEVPLRWSAPWRGSGMWGVSEFA